MTAPDPDYVQARLKQAATMLERRAFLAAEIGRLEAERDALETTIATAWPELIPAIAADMQAIADQITEG